MVPWQIIIMRLRIKQYEIKSHNCGNKCEIMKQKCMRLRSKL